MILGPLETPCEVFFFTALLGHPVQNNCYALIKKIFLQILVKTIFIKTPENKMNIFTYKLLGKKGARSSFLKDFLENIQK